MSRDLSLQTGAKIGRYEIRSLLGVGGMGEVYLARDTQLDRSMALKILTREVAQDQQRLHRFLQEARAASALSHPNVAHIYEIGEAQGAHFIAMEYVEGSPLDKKIHERPLGVIDLLDIAIQVADALDEAHSKGITHRDVKSSNIMITARGRVKVLDFGLARWALPAGAIDRTPDSEEATRVKTNPGMVMGTVDYMSPEQALGREVDHRTDIFSFGVVLYEMATGRLPFTAETVTETIDRIVHAQPEAIARLNYDVPAELEIIVKKALRKDRNERYQTLHDALVDLRELKRELDMAARREGSTPPTFRGAENRGQALIHSATGQTSAPPAPQSSSVPPLMPTSSADHILREIKRHRLSIGLIAGLVVISLLAGGIWLFKQVTSSRLSAGAPAIKFTRLTSGGKIGNELIVGSAAISPDGKYVIFWTQDQQKASCYVRQVATNSLVRIVGPVDLDSCRSTFSPDGEFVYYVGYGKNNSNGALFKVPVLGGMPHKILEGIWSAVTFSPDGKHIAYVRLFPATGESWLVTANADGRGSPQTIARRKLPDYFSADGPSWSPDGRVIALGAASITGHATSTVVEVPATGGTERPVTAPKWVRVCRVAWVNDGRGLVMTVWPDYISVGTQIWFVSYPEGSARRITTDLNAYGALSLGLTSDSNTIVTVQEDITRAIWTTAPNEEPERARQISNGKYEGVITLAPTPDDRIVYLDLTGEADEVWIMKNDGSEKKQLTSDGAVKYKASVSPDGRYVFFSSNRSGNYSIWRMDIDGNNQKQLTEESTFAIGPIGSNDGQWVLFQSFRAGKSCLWKVPIDGGEASQISDKSCALPTLSPDGKLIACLSPNEQASFRWQIAILPLEGGAPIKTFDLPSSFQFAAGLRWSPDGRAVTYVNDTGLAANIVSQPMDGGPTRQLTKFKSDRIATFGWSRDGKRLFLGRGPTIDDVVLIKDFR